MYLCVTTVQNGKEIEEIPMMYAKLPKAKVMAEASIIVNLETEEVVKCRHASIPDKTYTEIIKWFQNLTV